MTPEEVNKYRKNKKDIPKIKKYCPECDKIYTVSGYLSKCQICKTPFINIPQNPVPTCPTCGSTNIKKISDINRGVHALAFGLFSKTAKSQFYCLNCNYKW
jgi:transposase-like protein